MATPQTLLRMPPQEYLAYEWQSNGRWLYQATRGLDDYVEFPLIDCRLVLAEVNDRIIFHRR